MVGVQVRVFHKQSATMDQFSKTVEKREGSEKLNELIKDTYYSKRWSFQTPNFLNPDDVNLWKVGTWWTPITDPNKLGNLYKRYCNIKLDTMRNQLEIVGVDTEIGNGESIDGQKKEKNKSFNIFKTILRAYGEKGAKDERHEKISSEKEMWNSKNLH